MFIDNSFCQAPWGRILNEVCVPKKIPNVFQQVQTQKGINPRPASSLPVDLGSGVKLWAPCFRLPKRKSGSHQVTPAGVRFTELTEHEFNKHQILTKICFCGFIQLHFLQTAENRLFMPSPLLVWKTHFVEVIK